jgi:hypothetical protein
MFALRLNIDTDEFGHALGKPVSAETPRTFLNNYRGTRLNELLFMVNSMKVRYPSKVAEKYQDGWDPAGGPDQPYLMECVDDPNVRKGFDETYRVLDDYEKAGIDPFKEWLAGSREAGISPWLTIRMNDIHDVNDPRSPQHSTFWKRHPEMWRIPYRFSVWADRALDYGRKEVRDNMLATIRELSRMYDFDGFELDWMRFVFNFRPGWEDEGRRISTEITAEVRGYMDEAEKRVGHPIKLSARVPADPVTSYNLGYDAVEWARSGLVGRLTVTPFLSSDCDMPIEIWKQLLRGTDVELDACIEVAYGHVFGIDHRCQTIEHTRGMAWSCLSRGADGICLFNHMSGSMSGGASLINYTPEEYRALLCEAGSLEAMEGKPRRHLLTYKDRVAVGEVRTRAVPVDLHSADWHEFRVHTGKPPAPEDAVWLLVGFEPAARNGDGHADDDPAAHEARVNGVPCERDAGASYRAIKPHTGGREGEPLEVWRVPAGAIPGMTAIPELHGYEGKVFWIEVRVQPATGAGG